jgi:RNA polymerase sigma factor (sigma-70 family)
MPGNQSSPIARYMAKLVEEHEYSKMTDRELLRRFTKRREEAAFLALLKRHGTLIQRICRRMLPNAHDADDVFQATFLVLLKKVSALRWRDCISGWLHEVAYRLAVKTKSADVRRTLKESRATIADAAGDPLNALTVQEAQTLLHQELNRLPDRLRSPLVLCYLESQTQEEAARQLGWSVRTVKRRFQRGREILHQRLTRRGLTLAAALTTGLATTAPASASLIRTTLTAAVSFTSGKAGTIAAPVAVLVQSALGSMFLTKVKVMATLAMCLAATGLVFTQVFPNAWQKAWPGSRGADASETAKKDFKVAQIGANKKESRPSIIDDPNNENGKKAGVDVYGDPLPPGAVARLGTVRFRYPMPLTACAVSPDGRIIAGGNSYGFQLWDAETGRRLHNLPDLLGEVAALAFSPDGKVLATYIYYYDKLRFHDVATGKMVKEYDQNKIGEKGKSYTSHYLGYLPDGKHLLLKNGSESSVHLLDAASGEEVRTFLSKGNILYAVASSPDGKMLAVVEESGNVLVKEIATGKEVFSIANEQTKFLTVAFAPDSKTLATEDFNGNARLCEASTGKLLRILDARLEKMSARDPQTWSLNFSPDGKNLASSLSTSTVIWETTTGKEIRRLKLPHAGKVAYLPDDKSFMVGGGWNQNVHGLSLIDATTGKLCRPFDGHRSDIVALAFSADGQYVATADTGPDGEFRIWDKKTGKTVNHADSRHRWLKDLAFNPKGDILAVAHDEGITLWDVNTGKQTRTLPGKWDLSLTFSSDGSKLASFDCYHGYIRLHDTLSGKELRNFNPKTDYYSPGTIGRPAFSPDLRFAASFNKDQSGITLWDMANGKELMRFQTGNEPNWGLLRFSSDCRTLLRTCDNGRIHLWEIASGELRQSSPTAPGPALAVAFSRDGHNIAISNGGQQNPSGDIPRKIPVEIQIYDVVQNRFVSKLIGHEGRTDTLSYSPDDHILASGSRDTTVLLWDVAAPKQFVPRNSLTTEERAAGWMQLASTAEQAYIAKWKLVADKETVNLLRENLKPAGVPSAETEKHVRTLVADLGSEQFAVRSQATKQLAKIGTTIEEELRKTLKTELTPETRGRIEEVLASIAKEHLRNTRAVEVLEHVNTPAARNLLATLAKGRADATLTREAKGSLERLAKRSVK